jgi:hypothetical protein
MKATVLGTMISAVGYFLAIYGGWLLYRYAVPDRPYSTIFRGTAEEHQAFQKQQVQDMADREKYTPRGFILLTIGAGLQLAGTLVSGLMS